MGLAAVAQELRPKEGASRVSCEYTGSQPTHQGHRHHIGYHHHHLNHHQQFSKQQGGANPPLKSKSIMSNFIINTQSLEDTIARDGAAPIPGLDPENAIEATETTCLIHETRGGTILFFASKCPVNAWTYFRLTAEQFHHLVLHFSGAQTKWGQPVSNHLTASMGGQEQQQKLLDAGFKIYRFSWFDGQGGKITYCHTPGAWRLFEGGFTTKAALLRRKKEVLKDLKALEG